MSYQDAFGNGGLSVGFPSSDAFTPSGLAGRIWNNITGTTANNQFNAQEAEKARLFNSAEAQKERDWQTEMSNTAYQRAASDMQAAGINPASLGGNATMSPASSGSGATASGVAAHSASNSGTGLIGLVLNGVGMALKASIMRSALSNKDGYLDLAKFKAKSQAALNAAKVVESDATSALKQQELSHKAKMYGQRRTETWYTKPELDFNEEAKKAYDHYRETGAVRNMPFKEFKAWYYENDWNHGKPKRYG